MDAPFHTHEPEVRRGRRPVPAWIPLAVIVVVLTLAGAAASSVTDTRDFAEKHATVIPERLL